MSPLSGKASSDDVVAWLLGDEHLSLLDSEDRPLGERASPMYADCQNEERVVPFGDLRDASGLPANIAALRQVSGCLDACLPAFAVPHGEDPADHGRLRARTETLCLLAPLRALKDGGSAEVLHASAFKLCLGFREMHNDALLQERVEAEDTVDVEALMAWLGTDPLLIGDVQVCAGSRKQIRVVLGALLAENSAPLDPTWAPLQADWLRHAVLATTTLHDLIAIAASAALGLLDRGTPEEDAVSAALALHPRGPRISHALRARSEGGPLRVTLLYRPDAVPEPVRAMLDALGERLANPMSVTLPEVDGLLLAHARPVAATLMAALGRQGTASLTLEAFRRLCSPASVNAARNEAQCPRRSAVS